MQTLTATYRIVTPMFLGGADPTAEAELRLSSFKGALRFWWRAIMWGMVGDINELRRKESELFGSSESGQSKVLMQLDKPLIQANAVQERWSPASWECYTGYGIQDPTRGDRRFLRAGLEFAVHLSLPRCSEEQAQAIAGALKLFGLVGGLGFHSRKGWGSSTLTHLEGADWTWPADGAAWETAVKALAVQPAATQPPFTALTSDSLWKAGPVQKDAERAQRWLGLRYRDHVKATQPKDSRAQFGLPRLFQKGARPRSERRASPLFLHIHECPDGRALPCTVFLPADFLSDQAVIPGSGDRARRFVRDLNH